MPYKWKSTKKPTIYMVTIKHNRHQTTAKYSIIATYGMERGLIPWPPIYAQTLTNAPWSSMLEKEWSTKFFMSSES